MVIHRSLRDFRPLRYSRRDCHAEWEHVNRGRNTPSFCPTLQVLDISTLGDAADVNPVIKFLSHTLHVSNLCLWEKSADENVPNEKVLNCSNVAEMNILEKTFLNYMLRPSCHGGYREME